MIYSNQYLFQWHVNKNIVRNENLTTAQKVPVGYFSFYNNRWVFVNQTLESLKDITEDKMIQKGSMVELNDGKKLLLSKDDGGRLVNITITNK